VLRSRALYLVAGLCLVAFGLTRWVESLGGPAGIWERFGLVAPAVSVPVHAIVAVTPFPSDVVAIGNGTIYGFWLGSVLSWFGWYIAAFIEFQIGRRADRDFDIGAWIARAPASLRRFPVGHPAFLIGSRLIPWAGGHISTLLPGAMGVPLGRFAWCAALAIVPPAMLMSGIGAGLLQL
jgi:uncharacterized membrane protein YdjX (TVP38/TMEM64 family)